MKTNTLARVNAIFGLISGIVLLSASHHVYHGYWSCCGN